MLRPEFAVLLDAEQRARIVALVGRFVEVLASPAAAIDETHTPKLYAKFLHGQLRHVTVAPVPASAAPSPVAQVGIPAGASVSPGVPFAHLTPGESSSSSSEVPTPGPDQDGAALPDGCSWTDGSVSGSGSATAAVGAGGGAEDPMELCEDDFLATMQAVSSEQWLSSVLMPGFKWPAEEPQAPLVHDRFDAFSRQVV